MNMLMLASALKLVDLALAAPPGPDPGRKRQLVDVGRNTPGEANVHYLVDVALQRLASAGILERDRTAARRRPPRTCDATGQRPAVDRPHAGSAAPVRIAAVRAPAGRRGPMAVRRRR